MTDFKGKQILMFSPYGATKHYGEAIKNELQSRGAVVYGYDERPSQKTITKIVIRLFKKRIPRIFDSYISKVIQENIGGGYFDYILICRGEAFTPYTINHLRKAFPTAKILLYLWDILRCADIRANIPFVDKAMSFDPEDAANNDGLHFRPTFFVNDYLTVKDISTKAKYDVAFIGTLHSKRHKIIKSLCTQLTKQGLNFFTYLYVPSIIVYIKDFILKFPYIGITKVHFNPISICDTIKILDESVAVFDINYTGQKSLSTRAFEAMAARRKYITTNPEVKRYDFYNPNNILVVNIDNVVIPRQFLNTPFEPVPEQILYKYSVAGLIDDLLNETFNSKSIFLPRGVQNQRFGFSTGSKRTFNNCVNR